MPLQFTVITIVLNVTFLMLVLSSIFFAFKSVIKHRDVLEIVLRIFAISAGILMVGVSYFTTKSIPEIVIEALISSQGSIKIILVTYAIPVATGGLVGMLLIKILKEGSKRSIRVFLFIISMSVSFFYGSLAIVYDELEDNPNNIDSFGLHLKECEGDIFEDCKVLEEYESIFVDNNIINVPKGSSIIYQISKKKISPTTITQKIKKPYLALSPNIIFIISLILYLVIFFKNDTKY